MRILVPVDGSRFSQVAAEFIASRTTLLGTDPHVELLNVQLPIPVRAARLVGKDVVQSYYEDEATKAFRHAGGTLKKAGFEAVHTWRVGHPAQEIAAAADKSNADLIIMGSHGHGLLAGLVLGSVTNGVLAHSRHRALLVLRDGRAPKGDSLKVGIAVDGSKYGRAAVRYVLRHIDLFGAAPDLVLLHVVPDFAGAVMPDMAGIALPAFSPQDIEAMQAKAYESAVAPARRLVTKAGRTLREARLAGNAGDELANYAKKNRLDVLVMGSHGYGAFKQAVLGSVATRVTARCRTPLLLIRDA